MPVKYSQLYETTPQVTEELDAIRNTADQNYILMSDIDLSGTETDNDGDGSITANDALAVLRYSVGMGDGGTSEKK